MGLVSGAIVGLLVAVGTGKSKAKYAALGAAIGYGARQLYDMTAAGQQARRDEQARFDALRARAGLGDQLRRLNQPEWLWP